MDLGTTEQAISKMKTVHWEELNWPDGSLESPQQGW